jgi:hypothetical protein
MKIHDNLTKQDSTYRNPTDLRLFLDTALISRPLCLFIVRSSLETYVREAREFLHIRTRMQLAAVHLTSARQNSDGHV